MSRLLCSLTVDTAELSNFGQAQGVPLQLGDAGAVKAFWGTPPGWPNLGASFSITSFNSRLCVGLRYRLATMDHSTARELASSYKYALLEPQHRRSGARDERASLAVTGVP